MLVDYRDAHKVEYFSCESCVKMRVQSFFSALLNKQEIFAAQIRKDQTVGFDLGQAKAMPKPKSFTYHAVHTFGI